MNYWSTRSECFPDDHSEEGCKGLPQLEKLQCISSLLLKLCFCEQGRANPLWLVMAPMDVATEVEILAWTCTGQSMG